MSKCEFCDFDDKKVFRDFYDEETVNGLGGKYAQTLFDIDEAPDPDEEINEAYDDRMRIVKTNQGYFLESFVAGDMDYDTVRYKPIKYCPMCGRRLAEDEDEKS